MCLQCVYVGCKDHLKPHQEATGHCLFADVSTCNVFCSECNDYIYDPDFEQLLKHERGLLSDTALVPDKSRARFSTWEPRTQRETQAITKQVQQFGLISSATDCGASAGLAVRAPAHYPRVYLGKGLAKSEHGSHLRQISVHQALGCAGFTTSEIRASQTSSFSRLRTTR